ncbi:hypothetical protein ACFOPN_15190 [Xanthomonas hyacinthi]
MLRSDGAQMKRRLPLSRTTGITKRGIVSPSRHRLVLLCAAPLVGAGHAG